MATEKNSLDTKVLLEALVGLKNGDFAVRLPVDWAGLDGKIADTFNEIASLNEQMATGLDRISQVVGKEGKISQRMRFGEEKGGWRRNLESVNTLIDDMVQPTKEIARVIGSVARGDLSQSMPLEVEGTPLSGEFLKTAKTVNTMINQLSTFSLEVTRVAREVGTEGKLGGQAEVKGVAGTWKDLTESVNGMAANLTSQVRNIAEVTTGVAQGDLSRKITVEAKGEILELKDTINIMVDQLSTFAAEVTRVAVEVGTEGKLGGQAEVKGVSGTWKELTESVNRMAGNLTFQVRNIAEVTTGVAQGELSRKITVEAKGEILELKNTINAMVDRLNTFSSEVTRVARSVGAEGVLGVQAEVKGVSGAWKELTDTVNWLAGSLTSQVRNIAEVTTAVAKGDLSKKITVDVKGELLELKNTVNAMVDRLNTFAAEVTRVAVEVGTEGMLGGQAKVKGVSGTWKELTESVNNMAGNLTSQVRNIAEVTTGVAQGDLSRKITVEAKGEILELKNTINLMVDRLSAFASEVTRVAVEVGTEGKLGGQAKVKGVSGTWRELTESVNNMAGNLTSQVRNIAEVTTGVAQGDLSRKITVEAKGEILELKKTINIMVDQLSTFAAEVTRVAVEVGTEGKLGGQAEVKGVSGTWKELTESVNNMAGNLTSQVRNIAEVTTGVAQGDLSRKITVEAKGEILALKNTINLMVDQLSTFAAEVTRVAVEVGTEGKLGGQAEVKGVGGTWKDLTESVNRMAGNLTSQVRNIAEVTTGVAQGDLSRKITVEAKGEILELKKTINLMVDQLSTFAAEVTRVAVEVGTEGMLGGQAKVKGVSGTWKDLTESVNRMAGNLTSQVRNIAEVTTGVAQGDLSRKITVEAKGEILALKNTINLMVDQLSTFAAEVTRVAVEVGTEGKLGGQAEVKGVGGTWKDLTESVNRMAGNLTSQVRNIAEVTTGVAQGDLSRKIMVEAKGEILELKDTINIMVDQLSTFAAEVTRVAVEVGTEGKLGGQAEVKGVGGTWRNLTESVNRMAGNLTSQVRNIAQVTTGVAQGDLSRKITVEAKGEILELKDTINLMVDQLSTFAAEVTRVAVEVGTEGILGGQAEVKGVGGTWKDLTESVNRMAGNLTSQVRNIAEVTTGVAQGELSRKITVEAKGEILELKNTINAMVDRLNTFSSEVTRVARSVGAEGVLGVQAEVKGVSGAWKELTDTVNWLAGSLTSQVRNIAEVTTAVAGGDLSRKITVEAKGEVMELKNTINAMVDQLNTFAAEVTRVAVEVGTEGILGGQAEVKGVGGTWKDLTESVNRMAGNLTFQVRNIAEVTTGVAQGDLSRKITAEAKGEILELKDTINLMVDQLSTFAAEVTRVAVEVGTEGKLGGQAEVKGVSGTWKDLTESVNYMAGNLTSQVRNIAEVSTGLAQGDLSRKITVEAKGEILELKDTINIMVDQLSTFAAEVTRVAVEVGTEGKLGGQAEVKGVGGTWKNLTESVNRMASNLTAQVRNIAEVTQAVATGDLSKKITADVRGEMLQLKDTLNTMVDQLRGFAGEVTRVAREVGTEGRLGGQAIVPGVSGTWKDLTDNVNLMAGNLTSQVRNIATVTTAVANGDLSKKITVEVKGEILDLKNTVNIMVDQLNGFAIEVTRIAREVGTEGKLGGQAQVRGVSGIWKDLTDNVNLMAANLTDQVRNIAKVVTAVSVGNLKQKVTLLAKGEIAQLSDTINNMIDTLAGFSEQVTSVAKEVGVEGKLGGQASVPGAAGTWKDLTDNVNQLAANLTIQIRAIAEVSTAVTKGDFTRSITVEARGEVVQLKDNLNQMIRTLSDTTLKTSEQDWLKTNLTKFTRMLQGQRDITQVAHSLLSELAPVASIQHGVFYIMEEKAGTQTLKLLAAYGYKERKNLASEWAVREGLVGQCAYEKQPILLTNVPTDYVQIISGLGQATPLNIIDLPVLFEGKVKAVVELASFEAFNPIRQSLLEQLAESLGVILNTIEASARTEDLLKQSQSMSEELQTQQEELQQTNEELEEKARQLGEQKEDLEHKTIEIESARDDLKTKAEQLEVTSRYKSQFLSNMSHELRTPLNSLLILSQQLEENREANLTPKQVEFAKTIHNSGNDLLTLINDILDLSKIESGTVTVETGEIPFKNITGALENQFLPIAKSKKLRFATGLGDGLPEAIETDERRLLQILKNLLSNAFKFTEKGSVELRIDVARSGWSPDQTLLNQAKQVIGFFVKDTGIGIPEEKRRIVFEAFQQADGTTSRKYGGTGLGLAISRELAYLLGGELRLAESAAGEGSTFVLYLPQRFTGSWRGIIGEIQSDRSDKSDRSDQSDKIRPPAPAPRTPLPLSDKISPTDRTLLIVEDDPKFAAILLDMAHDKGFKAVVTDRGEEAVKLAQEVKPAAITLDLHLPDIDGWTVLDRIKLDPATMHIPVHIMSVEEDQQYGLERGAFAYLTKPATKEALETAFAKLAEFTKPGPKKLLIVEDNEAEQKAISTLLGNGDIQTKVVATGKEALKALKSEPFDCVVLDLGLSDMKGAQILEKIKKEPKLADIPIVVYTGKEISKEEETELKKSARVVIVKGARSPERLLAETALFLHRVTSKLPKDKRQIVEKIYKSEAALSGKKVLVVDDDVRNLFALTSLLESHNMAVVTCENGRDAIASLKKNPEIDVVLMDIMMPEMDGYETTREIRKLARFKQLPIIALTAKAMKGDREKCLEAGASDYITKPVNTEQLLSLMRVWLYR